VKRTLFWFFVVSLILITGYGLVRQPAPRARVVYATRAITQTFVREISAEGRLTARQIHLAFEHPARVVEVPIEPGDHIKKGALIARVDDSEARRQVRLAEARLRAFDESQAAERRRLTTQRKTLVRKRESLRERLDLVKTLFAAGAASRAEVTEAEAALREAEAQITEFDSQIEKVQAEAKRQRAELVAALTNARNTLNHTRLTAPVSGTLAEVPFVPGELAKGEAVLVVAGSLIPEARFPEAAAGELKPGQPARIELETQPGVSFQSRVSTILPPAEIGGAVWIAVRFTPLPGNAAPPGATFTAFVETKRIKNAVVVPLETLIVDGGATFLWTIENDRARKVRIKVLSQNLTEAAIEGIPPGTVVIRLPPEDLEEGETVQPSFGEGKGAGGT